VQARAHNSRIAQLASPSALVIGAVAEAADQEADGERDGGGRIGALLDRCAQEIAGFAGAFSDSFGGISRSFLCLEDTVRRSLREEHAYIWPGDSGSGSLAQAGEDCGPTTSRRGSADVLL
jgi:hypothetical protein